MIRIGILGCSSFSRRAMLPTLAGMGNKFKIAGVASRHAEKANDFAAQFKTTAFSSYESLLDCKALDAVYLPLPVGLHAEWIDRALDKGLHVLTEKSLASRLPDVRRLSTKADRTRLVLLENFQFRFHPQLALIKSMLREGRLGKLHCVRSSFGCPAFPDLDNIRYNACLGGGALLDMGAYTLKISQEFLGSDIEVSAAAMNSQPGREVDTWGGGFLKQLSGPCFSEVAFGFDLQYQCSLELWGHKGRLFTNRIFTAPPGYSAAIHIEDGNGEETIQVPPANHFELMLNYFNALIINPAIAKAEYAANLRQAELIHQFKEVANGK